MTDENSDHMQALRHESWKCDSDDHLENEFSSPKATGRSFGSVPLPSL